MRNQRFFIAVFAYIILFPTWSSAGQIDTALKNAKKEGKVVMLELGSIGCIPCEQMKPVMQRLKTTYKGRLEVFFIDVRVDREAARRFGVYMIPVQVFLDKSGKKVYRHIGYFPYEEIVPLLRNLGL